MKIRVNIVLPVFFLLILFLAIIVSAGCITKMLPKSESSLSPLESGDNGIPAGSPAPAAVVPEMTGSPAPAPAVISVINPAPYITPDPYRLPYRDHGNYSAIERVRVPKVPEFSGKYSLRSNTTAISVNVSQAPFIINLTFSPLWDSPDHTSSAPSKNGDGSVSGSGGINSFVFSRAVVAVYPEGSLVPVEREGYGNGYSVDTAKKITIYREGHYVITLTGDFMDVTVDVITGAAAEKHTQSIPEPTTVMEEEGWG